MPGNPICHWELMVNDVEKAQAFYGKVFDWSYEKWDGPMEYWNVQVGKEPNGGMMKSPDEAPHPSLCVFYLVDDLDATLAKAEEAGGKVVVPKMEIPTVGWHGGFLDPDGIFVGVFQTNA